MNYNALLALASASHSSSLLGLPNLSQVHETFLMAVEPAKLSLCTVTTTRAIYFVTFFKQPLTMLPRKSSPWAQPELIIKDIMTIIYRVHRRLDVIEEH